jgi:hypothetical protein
LEKKEERERETITTSSTILGDGKDWAREYLDMAPDTTIRPADSRDGREVGSSRCWHERQGQRFMELLTVWRASRLMLDGLN